MKKLLYLFLTVLIVACTSSDNKKSNVSWLFVHTADNTQVTNTTIVMPMTNDIFAFTDRPYRKHLYMNGTQYASLWDDNDDTNNFYTDPPNAVLTWVDEDEIKEVEVVITDADFDGVNIIYTIENATIKANQPLEGVSLFVDDTTNIFPFVGQFLSGR
jgi:hypothetical protein|tara:strand:+ start:316 stop:789 length:474 start_codon:yes stop_codon:yes gene_type:complete